MGDYHQQRRQLLVSVGRLLFGRGEEEDGWQRALARGIDVSQTTISFAASGKRPVSGELNGKLLALVEGELKQSDERKQRLRDLRDQLLREVANETVPAEDLDAASAPDLERGL